MIFLYCFIDWSEISIFSVVIQYHISNLSVFEIVYLIDQAFKYHLMPTLKFNRYPLKVLTFSPPYQSL